VSVVTAIYFRRSIDCFDSVDAVIFIAALFKFNQSMAESLSNSIGAAAISFATSGGRENNNNNTASNNGTTLPVKTVSFNSVSTVL